MKINVNGGVIVITLLVLVSFSFATDYNLERIAEGQTFYIENEVIQVKTVYVKGVYSSQINMCGTDNAASYVEISTPSGIKKLYPGQSTAFSVTEFSTSTSVPVTIQMTYVSADETRAGTSPNYYCIGSNKKGSFKITIPTSTGYCIDPDASESQGGILRKTTIAQVGAISSSKISDTRIDLVSVATPPATDTCLLNGQNIASGGQIRERICSVTDGNVIRSNTLNCPSNYACQDGACAQIQYTCTDNDGDNKDLKSSILMRQYIGGSLNTTIQRDDYCIDQSVVGEYLCTADRSNGYSEARTCTGSSCQNGACLAVTAFCTDSDGLNYFNRGTVQYKNAARGAAMTHIYGDECVGGRLREYACDNSNPNDPLLVGTMLDCPNGGTCNNGACVALVPPAQPTENYCTGPSSGGLDPALRVNVVNGTKYVGGDIISSQTSTDACTSQDFVKKYFCTNQAVSYSVEPCPTGTKCSDGICTQPGNVPFCSETDSGDNKYTKGTITYGLKDAAGTNLESTTLDDSCTADGKILEYYCDGNSKTQYEGNCPSGFSCSEGACKTASTNSTGEPGCQDSDNIDVFKKGENVWVKTTGEVEVKDDDCASDSTILEYYCSSGERRVQQRTCPADYICQDGACRKKSVLPAKKIATVAMKKGWNLFSIPLKDSIVTGNCEGFDNIEKRWNYDPVLKWKHPGTLEAGKGYWFKAKDACTLAVTGVDYGTVDIKTVTLKSGWNQIGAPANPTDLASLLTKCNVVHGPWEYNTLAGMYEKATAMVPGKGYFVKVSSDCRLGG